MTDPLRTEQPCSVIDVILLRQRDHVRIAVREPIRDGLDQRGEEVVAGQLGVAVQVLVALM